MGLTERLQLTPCGIHVRPPQMKKRNLAGTDPNRAHPYKGGGDRSKRKWEPSESPHSTFLASRMGGRGSEKRMTGRKVASQSEERKTG